jgi:uncharacterized membrane protein
MTPSDNKQFALRANVFVLRLARNWLKVALIGLTIYVALPFIAPTLMKLGLDAPARAIYTIYTPFCHQLPFRTLFLYGEQPVYPRYNVPNTGLRPFEDYAVGASQFDGLDIYGFDIDLLNAGRTFYGNDEMGYKMTLCARDIFIYMALLGVGYIYSIPTVRRHLRPVPLWLYVFLGLGPIGLDGFSQLLSYPPFELWEVRETAPFFRVVTGAVFGAMTGWLGFPYLNESFEETRRVVEAKLRRAGIDV